MAGITHNAISGIASMANFSVESKTRLVSTWLVSAYKQLAGLILPIFQPKDITSIAGNGFTEKVTQLVISGYTKRRLQLVSIRT